MQKLARLTSDFIGTLRRRRTSRIDVTFPVYAIADHASPLDRIGSGSAKTLLRLRRAGAI